MNIPAAPHTSTDTSNASLSLARRVLTQEAHAILDLCQRLDRNFVTALELLYACQGRVVVGGMGKSGLIGRKIAATLASTGTPAFFLHPAEGSHGDLGMVVRGDVFVAISNSGETAEVLNLLPVIKRLGVPLLALTGRCRSTLARQSDVVLDCSVREEAGGFGLVPTASTTATLALGDALALALLEKRGWRAEDFVFVHPGGTLGARSLRRVGELMHTGVAVPRVPAEAAFATVLEEVSAKGLGVTAVVDEAGRLQGVITDGDVRRHLLRSAQATQAVARDLMTTQPKLIGRDELAAKAVQVMEHHKITSLFILDNAARPEGVVHLHDLMQAFIV